MPIYLLPPDPSIFPDPRLAGPEGLLALGGDLSLERLLTAYSQGIFPWYGEGDPILWWSPDPRLVLFPERLHVPRRLRRFVRDCPWEVTLDRDFERVMRACGQIRRPQGQGTWIVAEMVSAYVALHRAGYAHSVEVRENGELVGGLYGVALGRAFFGESMFHLRPEASKVALLALVDRLRAWMFHFIDCQQTTEHMLRFGAQEVPRATFLRMLDRALESPDMPGSWANRVVEGMAVEF